MSNHLITKSVKLGLYGLMTVCVINIFSNFMQINLMNDYFVKDLYSEDVYDVLAEKNDSRVAIVGGLYSIFIFSSVFLIGRWFFVSAKINHLLGIKELNISPGWSVGWYFIPFANLVMPYRSLKETFKASFNSEEWQNNRVPSDFPIWWATFLLGNVFSNASIRMYMALGETYTYEQLNQISYIDIVVDVLFIVNAIFLLRIINIIYHNQKDKSFQLHQEN
ncbi:DUF4328 domain-containing protein [Gammaproteobacteria bacterium]|nr:DUF4328 domain-containing protein [Gammaproteobacteria bacterium]